MADPDRADLGAALRDEAQAAGGDAVLAVVPPNPARGTEPPPTIAAALAAADVYIAPALPSISHTRARKAATDAGVRGATMPGVTSDMLARVMSVDLDSLAARSHAVTRLLDDAGEARITCPRGSDLRLSLAGRTGISDHGDLTAPAAFGNLPCGEGFISPAGGEGVLYAGSLAAVGLVPEPVRLTVQQGRLVAAEGAEGEGWLAMLVEHGVEGRNLAELGVGTNDRATLTGNVLEDEKVLGTVHVAFGASAAIGGTVEVPVHLDCVVTEPTLTVGATRVLDGGRFALAATS